MKKWFYKLGIIIGSTGCGVFPIMSNSIILIKKQKKNLFATNNLSFINTDKLITAITTPDLKKVIQNIKMESRYNIESELIDKMKNFPLTNIALSLADYLSIKFMHLQSQFYIEISKLPTSQQLIKIKNFPKATKTLKYINDQIAIYNPDQTSKGKIFLEALKNNLNLLNHNINTIGVTDYLATLERDLTSKIKTLKAHQSFSTESQANIIKQIQKFVKNRLKKLLQDNTFKMAYKKYLETSAQSIIKEVKINGFDVRSQIKQFNSKINDHIHTISTHLESDSTYASINDIKTFVSSILSSKTSLLTEINNIKKNAIKTLRKTFSQLEIKPNLKTSVTTIFAESSKYNPSAWFTTATWSVYNNFKNSHPFDTKFIVNINARGGTLELKLNTVNNDTPSSFIVDSNGSIKFHKILNINYTQEQLFNNYVKDIKKIIPAFPNFFPSEWKEGEALTTHQLNNHFANSSIINRLKNKYSSILPQGVVKAFYKTINDEKYIRFTTNINIYRYVDVKAKLLPLDIFPSLKARLVNEIKCKEILKKKLNHLMSQHPNNLFIKDVPELIRLKKEIELNIGTHWLHHTINITTGAIIKIQNDFFVPIKLTKTWGQIKAYSFNWKINSVNPATEEQRKNFLNIVSLNTRKIYHEIMTRGKGFLSEADISHFKDRIKTTRDEAKKLTKNPDTTEKQLEEAKKQITDLIRELFIHTMTKIAKSAMTKIAKSSGIKKMSPEEAKKTIKKIGKDTTITKDSEIIIPADWLKFFLNPQNVLSKVTKIGLFIVSAFCFIMAILSLSNIFRVDKMRKISQTEGSNKMSVWQAKKLKITSSLLVTIMITITIAALFFVFT